MIDLADLEQLIAATLLCHDAMCSTCPARVYDWSEVEAAIKFTSDFSLAYTDPGAVEQALHAALSREDHAAFIAMSTEVQVALAELLTHDTRNSQ
jgi:hypothetical protein